MRVSRITPYQLAFKHPFGLSVGTRTHTDVVFVEIEHEGLIGYGEAAMPPYLADTSQSVISFIKKVDLSRFSMPFNMEEVHQYIDGIAPHNTPAKAAIDIALHDLLAKHQGVSIAGLWGNAEMPTCPATFTIGISNVADIPTKIEEGKSFPLYKVKLGGINDKAMIKTLVQHTTKPFCVDVNQGWTDKYEALDMIHWLKEKGCLFVEQPLPKEMKDEMAWITSQSTLPTVGDEAVQRLSDVSAAKDVYNGINIKLMKSTGLFEARQMLKRAKKLNLKVLVGCMSESSCGITAAAWLTPHTDWADLDGPCLINNDPFTGIDIGSGKIILPYHKTGTGAALSTLYPKPSISNE